MMPLMLNREFGTPLGQIFLSRRDGVETSEAVRALPAIRRWLPPFLGLVTLPQLLSRHTKDSVYRPSRPVNLRRRAVHFGAAPQTTAKKAAGAF